MVKFRRELRVGAVVGVDALSDRRTSLLELPMSATEWYDVALYKRRGLAERSCSGIRGETYDSVGDFADIRGVTVSVAFRVALYPVKNSTFLYFSGEGDSVSNVLRESEREIRHLVVGERLVSEMKTVKARMIVATEALATSQKDTALLTKVLDISCLI